MSVRKMFYTLVPCLGLAVASSVALRADNPHPNAIRSFSYGGSGCSQGTVGQSISNDRQVATLIFDSFVASSGPSVPVTEGEKHCQVTVTFDDVQGSNLFEMTTTYRGYTQLAAGATGSTSADYSGVKQINSIDDVDAGPSARDYLKSDSFKQSNRNSHTVVMDVLVAAGGGSGQSQRTVDSIDFKVTK